ncbi:MAG: alpha/beta fold hydrolase [Candidatus Pedobacter colombiensis]|uniref:Alpha/beta fold hydrolase n=1 Tax=Candidatus Pedobacter colombiensis TaxID=3121371 RepID=A0AAJ5W2U2_9SPHI|nr:alpha/beta fold hydrolase [Pedobacter sp.]WEK17453.1 MAG: alpha/beta fold hydrolase [Pedobacter sp.]
MKFKTILLLLILCNLVQANAQTNQYPIHVLQPKNNNKPILVFLTGDGGWNNFSIQLADEFGKNGYPVISLDTRKYFWQQKTPTGFGADMNTIISNYLKQWNKDSFYIVGYSFGAEVAAFLPAHLSASIAEKIKSLALLSPGYSNSFEVRFINMLNSKYTNKDKYKVYPELLKIKVPVFCIYGDDEKTDISQELKEINNIRKITIPGSHHYDDDVKAVAASVIKCLVN